MSGVDLLARAEAAQAEFEAHKMTLGDLEGDQAEEGYARFDELADVSAKAWDRVHADARAQGQAPAFAQDLSPLAGLLASAGGATDSGRGLDFFDAIVESAGAKSMSDRASMAMSMNIEGATIDDFGRAGFDWREGARNDLTWTGETGKPGEFLNPQRMPGITDLVPVVGPRVRTLMTNLTTTLAAVEWLQVASKTYGAAVVPEAQSSDPIDDGGTPPPNTVTSQVGGLKPYSDFSMSIESTTVKTIPVLHDVTEQALDDLQGLAQMIRAFMAEDVRVAEDFNLMQGDGGPTALDGLLGTKWNLPEFDPTGNTDIDAVLLAIGEVINQGSYPTAMAINPLDWHSTGFLLAKDGNQNYQLGNPRADIDQLNALWGMRVIPTPTVPVGSPVVGDYRQAIVWDRMRPRFAMTNSHNDHFARNIVTMRLEERLAFGVRKPSAFRVITTP